MAKDDPFRPYNFRLEFNSVVEAYFTECSGLSVKIDTIAYRDAGNSNMIRHIPGPVEFNPITLKYGVSESREMWDWLMKSAQGNIERRNVSIVMLDPSGSSEIMRWELEEAWPSEWRGETPNPSEKGMAIESLVLVYDQFTRR